MKICAATGNAGKLRELRRILEAQGHEVVSQKELGITIEPDETGTTFAENALIKAETICGQQKRNGVQTKMPKTLPEKIIFTIITAAIMVYGMIVYNVALATGGVTNATFGMALHEMPIMVPVAFVLEFFVVEKLATALAFTFMKPTDRPQFITYAISLMIVCIMCPVMSLVATLLFKEPSFGTWVHTWGCNMPMALCWQMLYCGPLSRAIFRLLFRRGEKKAA